VALPVSTRPGRPPGVADEHAVHTKYNRLLRIEEMSGREGIVRGINASVLSGSMR
jgi:hypothetical protein